MPATTYYVYVDKTDAGEVFYVGKGVLHRLHVRRRNRKHKRISTLYGCHREVIWSSDSEQEALAYEEQLITFFGTYTSDWSNCTKACNFTVGGDGVSGRQLSAEARAKVSTAQRGRKRTAERNQRNGDVRRGKKLPLATKLKMSRSRMGRPCSPETKRKISEAKRAKGAKDGA